MSDSAGKAGLALIFSEPVVFDSWLFAIDVKLDATDEQIASPELALTPNLLYLSN